MPLNMRLHFYRSPVGQIVPKAEQLTLAFFDTIALMTQTVARSAQSIAPTRAHSDRALVFSVIMVQTLSRKPQVEVVCDTPNDRDTRVIVRAMIDASFTLWNVSPKAASSSAPRAPLSLPTWARLRSNESESHAMHRRPRHGAECPQLRTQ